jgi:hypothetical protein
MKSAANLLDTHQKALAINLDPSIFGSFAEIGAGQEVARWFLRVGAASGTVAKTVSAYSKPVSDSLYGTASRYVSMQRLETMIDREWNLLLAQLQPSLGSQTRLFSFADTISALNFAGTNECHGWMGIRFQDHPEGTANDLLLHLNLRDPSNLLQQEALGVVGVNLIYAVFHLLHSKESSLKALLDDEVTSQRVEIDFIELRGPAFEGWNRQETLLTLVREGLAEAVVFSTGQSQGPPTEILRKKTIVLAPFGPRSIESTQREMLSAAILQLKAESEIASPEPLSLFALSISSPSIPYLLADSADLSHRVDALRANSSNALVFGYAELYRMTSFVNRYTQAPVRFAVEVSVLIHFLFQAHGTLEGRLLEGLSKLFAQNVRVYAYPTAASAMQDSLASVSAAGWQWEEKSGLITADALRPCPPLGHLYSYLLASGFVVPMQCNP